MIKLIKIFKEHLEKRISLQKIIQGIYLIKLIKSYDMLKRLLCALSQFRKMGYVQGMNFIAGASLYHCKEEFAYPVIM